MMNEHSDWRAGIEEWLTHSIPDRRSRVSAEDSMREAGRLLAAARDGQLSTFNPHQDPEVLYAIAHAVTSPDSDQEAFLANCEAAYYILSSVDWPLDPLAELADLRNFISVRAWFRCLQEASREDEQIWWSRLPSLIGTPFGVWFQPDLSNLDLDMRRGFIEAPTITSKAEELIEASVFDLYLNLDSDPSRTHLKAAGLYRWLAATDPGQIEARTLGLGRLAMIAGTSLRSLTRLTEAREWLRRSEAWLLESESPLDLAVLEFQWLGLLVEERRFQEVLPRADLLTHVFSRAGYETFSLKCRFLEHAFLVEKDVRSPRVLSTAELLVADAKRIGSERVIIPAVVRLIQTYCELGESEKAFAIYEEHRSILRKDSNPIAIAKLQWGYAILLRKTGRLEEAIEVLRIALNEFQEMRLGSDLAAIHLFLADLLLETGREDEAVSKVRASLPIIDELKMLPEGLAAVALLRKSLRRRSIDRGALQRLHGYFEKISP